MHNLELAGKWEVWRVFSTFPILLLNLACVKGTCHTLLYNDQLAILLPRRIFVLFILCLHHPEPGLA